MACTLRLDDLRDVGSAVARLRRLFDLDADPKAVDDQLSTDPTLATAVAEVPGIRVPGSVDGDETLLRALLEQHASTPSAAKTALNRLITELGEPLSTPDGELTTLFPTAAAIADHATDVLTGPSKRTDALRRVSTALAEGELAVHIGRDTEELHGDLLTQPGIDPRTADYVLMRVLGAPDVLLTSDVGRHRGAAELGLPTDPEGLLARSRGWSPWRSYAGMHMWRAAAAAPTRRTA